MIRKGGAFVLGGAVVIAAIAFASRSLGVAGLGIVLAAVISRVWVGLARGPMSVTTTVEPAPATEGDVVRLRIESRRASRVPLGSLFVSGTLGRAGGFECRLRGRRHSASGEAPLGPLPRGRFVCSDAVLELADPLGLEVVRRPLESSVTIVVHPRIVELETLFSDSGRLGDDGRRLLLRRSAGFDFHSVREYEQGESLRRVHWPTTARRGTLMVKELEESPRDAVVVLLDCDPTGDVGDSPDSSFDAAARAAGSVLRAHVARGRRAALVTTGKPRSVVQASSLDGNFNAALGALAAAEPDAAYDLARALGHPHSHVAQAGELVAVTSSVERPNVERLLDTAARRLVSVVWIDAPSYVGRPTRVATGVLQLVAAGVPVAVVRRGDDLAAALGAVRGESRAHA